MRTFHHVGIPTTVKHDDEMHLEEAGIFITDATTSPNRIEWLRFEAHSQMPDILKSIPHIAYAVDDLDAALEGGEILLEPFEPFDGVRVAFVVEEGAPIELMQFG